MPHELTPEQRERLVVALAGTGPYFQTLAPVVAQMLADERERIADAIEDSASGGISRGSVIRLGALAHAARIARGQA